MGDISSSPQHDSKYSFRPLVMNETSMAARAVDLFQIFSKRTEESLFINSNLRALALLLTRQCARIGTPTRHAGGPLSLSMFPLLTRSSHAIFSARIFLIVPSCTTMQQLPKLPFCKSLSRKCWSGARI